ncbi:hypothetical protein [Streptomyces sp. NPDC058964]|uniref:hypothetical protein n=1 Tax=Streptomyces sp. NPDC058964 TaxID=3346681 RepID=UPI0036CB3D0F
MGDRKYTEADIRIVEIDEHVRANPAMRFGAARGNPGLATRVPAEVLSHVLHPAARLAPLHTLRAEAEVLGDLVFSIRDDRPDALDERGLPREGYCGSLLGPDRWIAAAAAALCARTLVEVWRDGHGLRQELAGIRPAEEPRRFDAPTGAGTRLVFELDETHFGPGAVIAGDLTGLDLHGPYCAEPPGPGHVGLRDLRGPGEPVVIRHR